MYVKDNKQAIFVKEEILGRLKQAKELVGVEIPEIEGDYKIVEDSIYELKSTIQTIREKIPRIGNDIEESEI